MRPASAIAWLLATMHYTVLYVRYGQLYARCSVISERCLTAPYCQIAAVLLTGVDCTGKSCYHHSYMPFHVFQDRCELCVLGLCDQVICYWSTAAALGCLIG